MIRTKHLKGECQQCGGGIEFPAEIIGTAADCPHCGQKTELTLAAPPQEPVLPRRVVVWTVGGITVLVLGLFTTLIGLRWFENYAARTGAKRGQTSAAAGSTGRAAQGAAPSEDPIAKAGFQISPVELQQSPDGTPVHVVGTLKNATNKPRFGVRLEFDLLDGAGERVGTAKDYLSVMEPKGEWRFRALVMEARAVSARVASIKEGQ